MRHIIMKGQEHKLYISNISDEDAFMYPSYQQAQKALEEIIAHANDFDKNNLCQELYSYSQNIITFTAGRGEGKTSTMISFSTALQNGTISKKIPGNYIFQVMPPIDPTIMENNQNILHLILSRMYHLAEKRWSGACMQNGFSHSRPSEGQKNELLCKFQKCLRAIDAIKCSQDKEHNLIDLSIVSDSSVLKQDFYELTNDLLSFGSPNNEKGFLVIQLDDTDFQFAKAYQIMEDIRKFLSVPNIIILMATDMSMLRTVVLNHFKDILDVEKKSAKSENLASKYIDKIIPPFHAIHLPKLDESIIHYNNARICYQAKDGSNVLLSKTCSDETLYSVQELLLRYIYRKTGIIFIAPKANYHSILPTTLRGMAQLLSLLSTMEDVPEISEDECENGQKLRDSMYKRVCILETNILRFEKYFLNEWAYAKLSHDQVDLLNELTNAAPNERMWLAVNSLTSLGVQPRVVINNDDYAGLEEYFDRIVGNRPDSARLIFALETCFTLLHHKALVEQIKKATAAYNGGLFAIDYSSVMNDLPTSYRVPNKYIDEGATVTGQYKSIKKDTEVTDLTKRCLVQKIHHHNKIEPGIYVMHLLNVALAIGRYIELNEVAKSNINIQAWIFQVQWAGLTVVPNWEVRNYIFKELEKADRVFEKEAGEKLLQTWNEVLTKIEDVIQKINTAKDGAIAMLACNFLELMKIIENADYRIGAVEKFFDDYRSEFDPDHINNIIISRIAPYYSKYYNIKSRFWMEKRKGFTQEGQRDYIDTLTHLAKDCDEMISAYGFKTNGTYFVDILQTITLTPNNDIVEHLLNGFEEKFKDLCQSSGIKFSKMSQKARSRIIER